MEKHGLVALDQEIFMGFVFMGFVFMGFVFMGFVFMRFAPGLPSVRKMAAPYLNELEIYRME